MAMDIEIDKASSFTLEMKIDGEVSSREPPVMRFSIVNKDIIISLNANRIDNGVYEIHIPVLKGILDAGEYQANVEVFIDGKHFIPLKETVKLKQELKPIVKISESATKQVISDTNISIDKIEIKRPIIKKTHETLLINK